MSFLKNLNSFTEATKEEKANELWDVKGILKKYSNQELKFDLRPLSEIKEDVFGKEGSINTKADKMVFETEAKWIVVDIEELHLCLRDKKKKIIYLDDVLNNFEWNIVIYK